VATVPMTTESEQRVFAVLDWMEFKALDREAFYRRHPGQGGSDPDYHFARREVIAEIRRYLTGQWTVEEAPTILEAMRVAVETGQPMTPEVVEKIRAAWRVR
jgi:hypothetical protein